MLRACDLIGRLRRDQCGCVRGPGRAARTPQGSAAAAELFFYEMKGRGRAVPRCACDGEGGGRNEEGGKFGGGVGSSQPDCFRHGAPGPRRGRSARLARWQSDETRLAWTACHVCRTWALVLSSTPPAAASTPRTVAFAYFFTSRSRRFR